MDKNAINPQVSATTRTSALVTSTTEEDGDHGFLKVAGRLVHDLTIKTLGPQNASFSPQTPLLM